MTLTDLFENPALSDPPAQPHSPTSRAAADAIRPDAATLREKVYAAVRAAADGLTDEEGIDATGIPPSTRGRQDWGQTSVGVRRERHCPCAPPAASA